MNPDEALNHFEQALGADARPQELQDESRVVGAMVDAIAANPSPPATVPSLDVARRARARGRRRVASVVAIAALCTTSVAAATGGIPAPDLIDWSNFLPGRDAGEPPVDESDPNFELGDVELPTDSDSSDVTEDIPEGSSDSSDDDNDGVDTEEPQDPSESGADEDRKGGPSEEKKSEAEDRKGGPSEEKKSEAEDRKGGPSEEKKRGEGWKNLEAEEADKSNSEQPNNGRDKNAEKNIKEKRSDSDVQPEQGNQNDKKDQSSTGEPREGHEGSKEPKAKKNQPNGPDFKGSDSKGSESKS